MIKILIADDQELIRDSLRIVLSGNTDFSVNTAANGIEVVRAVRSFLYNSNIRNSKKGG